jgi:hypothetical protein
MRRKYQLKNVRMVLSIVLILIFSTLFSGCDFIDNLEVKTGMKNRDFEYIKQGKVQKIIIQNTRDKGFRFVVTDEKAIQDLYNILSSAKHVSSKSSLQPDYIFEMDEDQNNVHKFNYIAGLDRKDGGNLYGNGSIYIVSDRIDNDIIKSLWDIRKPKDFKSVYYGSIIQYLNEYNKQYKESKGKLPKIGININDDVDIAKFILSTDLEEFKSDLADKTPNAELMVEGRNYDVIMNVKTQGYKSTQYKSSAVFSNNIDKSEKKYYMLYKVVNTKWQYNLFTDATKPSNF